MYADPTDSFSDCPPPPIPKQTTGDSDGDDMYADPTDSFSDCPPPPIPKHVGSVPSHQTVGLSNHSSTVRVVPMPTNTFDDDDDGDLYNDPNDCMSDVPQVSQVSKPKPKLEERTSVTYPPAHESRSGGKSSQVKSSKGKSTTSPPPQGMRSLFAGLLGSASILTTPITSLVSQATNSAPVVSATSSALPDDDDDNELYTDPSEVISDDEPRKFSKISASSVHMSTVTPVNNDSVFDEEDDGATYTDPSSYHTSNFPTLSGHQSAPPSSSLRKSPPVPSPRGSTSNLPRVPTSPLPPVPSAPLPPVPSHKTTSHTTSAEIYSEPTADEIYSEPTEAEIRHPCAPLPPLPPTPHSSSESDSDDSHDYTDVAEDTFFAPNDIGSKTGSLPPEPGSAKNRQGSVLQPAQYMPRVTASTLMHEQSVEYEYPDVEQTLVDFGAPSFERHESDGMYTDGRFNHYFSITCLG